jgi:VWFA-related protein
VTPRPIALAAAAVIAVLPYGAWLAAQAPTQPPVFRSTVEVTSIDATVVDGDSHPITDLTPGEFTVDVDGQPRRVVSAEWVSMVPDEHTVPPPPLPEDYSTNVGGTAGRLIVLVVDQPNIRFGGGRTIMKAAGDFLDTLQPADRVAVVGFGTGGRSTAFLSDRERSKVAIASMRGEMEAADAGRFTTTHMSLAEALAIERGDDQILAQVIERECGVVVGGAAGGRASNNDCAPRVRLDAVEIAEMSGREGDQTVRGLRELLKALGGIEGPKTMVIMTEGFVMQDQVESPLTELGGLASAARTSIYVLKLENAAFDMDQQSVDFASGEDRQRRTSGVMALAAASRGTVFNVTGSGAPLFEKIGSEISGYYLIGVESAPGDRDGKPHPIRVRVSRAGATVRARRTFLDRSSLEPDQPKSMSQEAMDALGSPLLSSALPLRVITFSLRDQDPAKVQLLIHADVGDQYTQSRQIAVAYVIADPDGHEVQNLGSLARVGPVMNGVPSPLLYSAGASLPPGDYRLKLAVAEGDRVGSIEHTFHAGLLAGGQSDLSDLMVGGPVESTRREQPLVTPVANFGVVQGYLEAYGRASASLKVRYEIARSEDGPAILGDDVPAESAGPSRTMFSRSLVIRQLPPGSYYLRAIVSENGEEVSRLARAFDVAPPSVLMSSAVGARRAAPADTDLFLPVEQSDFASQFEKEEALARPALQRFEALVDTSVKPAFDAGVKALDAGDYEKAEASFKSAIRPDVDSTPGLVYLAATYAAAGHDQQAAGAWQTALVDGDDHPEIYRWLAEALLRDHDLSGAQSILDEGTSKWPSDPRLTRPMAMLYATFGKGIEAVRTMERYLDARPDDVEALEREVEWIYSLKLAGASAHSPEEDAALARQYAAAYEKAGGQRLELMHQWLDFLDVRRPGL